MDPSRDMSQYVRDTWGTERGFPGGPVHAIAQTPDGYLWLGTEKGLVRFDGFAFQLIPPMLDGQRAQRAVLGLTADADGSLWVRLAGPFLLKYRYGSFTTVRIGLGAEALVTAMTRGRDGRLLASSMSSGTIRDRGDRFEVLAPPAALPKSVVISIGETAAGDVWLGTRDAGLVGIRGARVAATLGGVPDSKINALLPDGDGALWVGTDRGVVRWADGAVSTAGVPRALASVQALAMIRDRESNVWIGTAAGAVMRVSAGSVSELPADPGQSRGAVTALFEDRDGNVWVGSAFGLERVRDTAFATFGRRQGLPSDTFGPVHADGEGRVWYARADGGVGFLERGHPGSIDDRVLSRDVVYSITGRGNDIWLGRQRGGLTRFRSVGGTWAAVTYTEANGLAQNSIYAVHEARDGAIWAGTLSAGASAFRDGRFVTVTTADGLASNTVTAIADGPDGSVWFGTPNGVSVLASGTWRTVSAADGLPSNDIACLEIDREGVAWVGTGSGLAIIDGGQVRAPKGSHLPQEAIVGIVVGEDSVWIASTTRVLRVSRDRLRAGDVSDAAVREYGVADGLLSTEGVRRQRSAVADARGRIWLSLGRGLSMTDPSRRPATAPALAHVESVIADGRPVALDDAVRVPAGRQRLIFSYTGLSLSVPERIRFRYRLDGFDRDWSEPVAAREAAYTNLGPGPYRFRVVAANSEGEWNPAEAAVEFRIAPRVWQTTWFRLGAVVAIVLGSAGLYRLRLHQVARQLSVRFEERLAERTRVAQDLHDTLLQGFVSASMQLHVAAGQVAQDSPARGALDRVLQLMGRVIDEGRHAVRGLRAPASGGDDLEQAFCAVVQELGGKDRAGVRVTVEGRPRPLHAVVRDEVYRIGREAIVNAVRHAEAPSIELELAYTPAHLRVLVRDNGRGIDEQVLQAGRDGHWGLSGMRERAERIGARLTLSSRPGAGTEIELVVPARVAFRDRGA
jgi:signal transduction histidine kinase/ligand-binding sensor domain-containing protein